jgi:hypothetical protein
MALIKNIRTQQSLTVEPELMIGRSSTCRLRVEERYISSCHAMVRWTGSNWQVKDLGSRNGTFVNGTRLDASVCRDLMQGDQISFGHVDERWELLDSAAPHPMLIPEDGGDPVQLICMVTGIPDAEAPKATAFRDRDGLWKIEDEQGAIKALRQGQSIELVGRSWRFSSPDAVGSTEAVLADAPPPVQLTFRVSLDEEHVELLVVRGERILELGARSHNYLLLQLARARMRDERDGISDTSAGWVYREDLERALAADAARLNIDVFRIREHFSKFGLHDCLTIIERRPRTGQLRIGTGKLQIVNL